MSPARRARVSEAMKRGQACRERSVSAQPQPSRAARSRRVASSGKADVMHRLAGWAGERRADRRAAPPGRGRFLVGSALRSFSAFFLASLAAFVR